MREGRTGEKSDCVGRADGIRIFASSEPPVRRMGFLKRGPGLNIRTLIRMTRMHVGCGRFSFFASFVHLGTGIGPNTSEHVSAPRAVVRFQSCYDEEE